MTDDYQVTDEQRIKIATQFICLTPPGEFTEVFNDIRILLNNDQLLKEKAGGAISKYNKDQMTPVILPGNERASLVSHHSEIEGYRFHDPNSKSTFAFDHLRREPINIRQDWNSNSTENYRSAFDRELLSSIKEHFPGGSVTVYGNLENNNFKLLVCIENHKFSQSNFWNGRWRSEWAFTFAPRGEVDVRGILKVQVHYYEAGNVQLVSSKEIKDRISEYDNEEQLAKKARSLIENSENYYQDSLNENYRTMNTTTFKALRRALPITHMKVDWLKIKGMTVAKELSAAL